MGGGNEGVDWVGRGSCLLTGGKVNGVGDSSAGMELDGTWGVVDVGGCGVGEELIVGCLEVRGWDGVKMCALSTNWRLDRRFTSSG